MESPHFHSRGIIEPLKIVVSFKYNFSKSPFVQTMMMCRFFNFHINTYCFDDLLIKYNNFSQFRIGLHFELIFAIPIVFCFFFFLE